MMKVWMNLLSGILITIVLSIAPVKAQVQIQSKGLVNTSDSPYAKVCSINMGDAVWTHGFWANRFKICVDSMVPNMWRLLDSPKISHNFRNFQIAAGLMEGVHKGPSFDDGDFYKWLEAASADYAITRQDTLGRLLDRIIKVVAKAQRKDGYINTPVIISHENHTDTQNMFTKSMSFELYNFGHLMTAACVYYRATGKKTLLHVATKAADFLENYYKKYPMKLATHTTCPSHYMGLAELYRTTHNKKYLHLLENLINIRAKIKNGTPQNQDQIPFREQRHAVGHAVRANYLYAGAADLYAETGDKTLLTPLHAIWNDVVQHKMYITGATGALYDGVSPDGTTFDLSKMYQIHQAYGRPYQLPNLTAYNESCANVGNALWNYRMFLISGKAKYMDVLEQTLYNSILDGISLNGKRFFYTNPLAVNNKISDKLRWSKNREPYINVFCCPPNVVRTIAEAIDYAYGISKNGIWFNLYGGSQLNTMLFDGSKIKLTQISDYPWKGKVKIVLNKVPDKKLSFYLRIPGWCDGAKLSINGKPANIPLTSGTYVKLNRIWKAGDTINLDLPMHVKLMEANPLVESDRNEVAVKRGPLVYCLESADYPEGVNIFNIAIPANVKLKPLPIEIADSKIVGLTGEADLLPKKDWKNSLYQQVSATPPRRIRIHLIPYYSWDNRGKDNMTVWIPLIR